VAEIEEPYDTGVREGGLMTDFVAKIPGTIGGIGRRTRQKFDGDRLAGLVVAGSPYFTDTAFSQLFVQPVSTECRHVRRAAHREAAMTAGWIISREHTLRALVRPANPGVGADLAV
jgi:hypothetical protein